MNEPAHRFEPCLRSLAFQDIPVPDFADVCVIAVPESLGPIEPDPTVWASAVFNEKSAPRWVQALFAVRQLAVRLVGIPPASNDVFRVAEAVGDEAVIRTDDRHLDFRCGVGIDAEARLLRVTTVVRLKGWRGRLYFVPVRLLHGPITQAMAKRAITNSPSRRPPSMP